MNFLQSSTLLFQLKNSTLITKINYKIRRNFYFYLDILQSNFYKISYKLILLNNLNDENKNRIQIYLQKLVKNWMYYQSGSLGIDFFFNQTCRKTRRLLDLLQ